MDGITPGPTTWTEDKETVTVSPTGCQWDVTYCYGTDASGNLFIYVESVEWVTGSGCPTHTADGPTLHQIAESLQTDYIWNLNYHLIPDCDQPIMWSELVLAECWQQIDLHTITGGHENYKYVACPVPDGMTCIKHCIVCKDGLDMKFTGCYYTEEGTQGGCPLAPGCVWDSWLCYNIGCVDIIPEP